MIRILWTVLFFLALVTLFNNIYNYSVYGSSTVNPVVNVVITEGSFEPPSKTIKDYYRPSLVLVAEDTTVIWENQDSVEHTITSGTSIAGHDGRFDSRLIFSNDRYDLAFDESGIYGYFCKIHPWMSGAIVVAPKSIFNISSKKIYSVGENILLNGANKINFQNTYYFPKGIKSISPVITISDSNGKIYPKNIGDTSKFPKSIPRNDPYWKTSSGPYTAELKYVGSPNAKLISITKFDFEKRPETFTPLISSYTKIPEWFKQKAGLLANGKITDNDFVKEIQNLIRQKIINFSKPTAGSGTSNNVIPESFKQKAGLLANGKITDNDFVKEIQNLIKYGKIKV